MPNAMMELVAKGGQRVTILLTATPFWLAILAILIVAQRHSLRRLVVRTVNAAPYPLEADPTGERVVADCLGKMGPLSGGAIGAVWLGLWWLLVLVVGLWSVHSPFDPMRYNESGYLESVVHGGTAHDLVRQYSAVLITRGFIGILGIPGLMVTLLALDQIVFRPRTRLRDEIQRQWLQLGEHSAEIHPAADGTANIKARAAARFSWMCLCFNWAWLLVKRLPRRAALIFACSIALGLVAGALEAAGILPSHVSPEFQLGTEPTTWVIFWRPFLEVLAVKGPLFLLVLWVGVSGPGWAANRHT